MSTKTNDRRRAHYMAAIGTAPTYRRRVAHAADWARALLAGLPTHLHDVGFERLMSLVRDLERMGAES